MEATATKGVWIERLPRGYTMSVNTNNKKIRVFSPSKEDILGIECPKGLYPDDIERVRDFVIDSFKLYT